jgi:hypothetical protein
MMGMGMGMAKTRRRECGLRNRSKLELGKHDECYHEGVDNLRVIQGIVELRGSVAILGAEARGAISKESHNCTAYLEAKLKYTGDRFPELTESSVIESTL